MKVKYTIAIAFIFVGLVILALDRYNRYQEEKTAHSRLKIAENFYIENHLASSSLVLDSIKFDYGHLNDVIFAANKLQLAINKQLYADSIAKITLLINQIEGEKSIDSVNLHSLINNRMGYEKTYMDIEKKEKQYECPQCAIYLRNARK